MSTSGKRGTAARRHPARCPCISSAVARPTNPPAKCNEAGNEPSRSRWVQPAITFLQRARRRSRLNAATWDVRSTLGAVGRASGSRGARPSTRLAAGGDGLLRAGGGGRVRRGDGGDPCAGRDRRRSRNARPMLRVTAGHRPRRPQHLVVRDRFVDRAEPAGTRRAARGYDARHSRGRPRGGADVDRVRHPTSSRRQAASARLATMPLHNSESRAPQHPAMTLCRPAGSTERGAV